MGSAPRQPTSHPHTTWPVAELPWGAWHVERRFSAAPRAPTSLTDKEERGREPHHGHRRGREGPGNTVTPTFPRLKETGFLKGGCWDAPVPVGRPGGKRQHRHSGFSRERQALL